MIKNCLAESGQRKDLIVNKLEDELFKINKVMLCEGCKEKEIKKLADKCGNEEISRFLYDCKPSAYYYIRWISFDEFKNIEYLAKGGFGEVHKATWINYYDTLYNEFRDIDVVLKRVYDSNDKIVDILKEVKVYYYY